MSAIEPAEHVQATSPDSGPPATAGLGARPALAARLALLVIVLFVEKFVLNFFVNTARADTAQGIGATVRLVQHIGFRFAVPFALALALLVFVRRDSALERVSAEASFAPIRARWAALHVALFAALAASLEGWYGRGGISLPMVGLSVGIAAAATLALLAALAPLALWYRSAWAIGARWLYAATAAIIASAAFTWSQQLWGPTAGLTFDIVRVLLAPLLPTLHADATTRILATRQFAIYVAPYCSGLEGVELMLVFCSAWLLYFRKEYIFPRALILIPAGVLLVFGLNAVRIAALMLIGHGGFPSVAMYGFHSEAGWIGFNCAACAVAVGSRRIRWLSSAATGKPAEATSNPTAAYLLPFLAVLAAGMVARATSSGFETWYALRLLAAAVALACCWRPLTKLDWRFGWRGIAAGVAIFAIWLAAGGLLLGTEHMPAGLATMSPGARQLWISSRAFTAILIIPIAEELAYRGYLMRRLLAENFEAVPFGSIGWVPLAITAIAFGVLHGAFWLPAIVAGLAYGAVLIRTGRMGEAIAAHATTNLLIAVWVVALGQWQLWH